MYRYLSCFIILVTIYGCGQRWTGTIVKKRVYLKGFYVHTPSKRFTPVNSYPKPSPYPTQTASQSPAQTPSVTSSSPQAPAPPLVQKNPPLPAQPSPNVPPVNSPGSGGSASGPPSPPVIVNAPVIPGDTGNAPLAYRPPADTSLASRPADTTRPVAQQSPPPPRDPWISGTGFGYEAHAGFITGPQAGQGYLVTANSFVLGFGARGFVELKKKFHFNADAGYRLSHFYIGENGRRAYPLTVTPHDRERIARHNFFGAFCGRVAVNKNKETAKWKYIDFGLFGEGAFRTAHVYKDFRTDSPLAERERSVMRYTGLRWMQDWSYGFTVRCGKGPYSVFALWRCTDLVKVQEARPLYLPKLVLGFELTAG